MGFHNVLTGEDLHEPSRIRMVNDVTVNQQQVTLLPGQLVKIDGGVIEGVLTVTELAEVGNTLVGFVDTIIASGNEATIVLFGRLLDVEVEDPTGINQDLKEGDFLRVNSSSRFEKIDSEEGRVATVLRRTADSTTMNVLFNPTSSVAAPVPQIMVLNTPSGLISFPASHSIAIPNGGTTGRSVEIPLTFQNTAEFARFASTDSFQLSGASILIEQAGSYELTIPTNLNFPLTWTVSDALNPMSGNALVTFILIVRLFRLSSPDIDVYRFQVSPTDFMISTNPADPTVQIDLSGNIETTLSTSSSPGTTDFYSSGLQPKIIDLEVGDLISYRYEIIYERDDPTNAAGDINMVYNAPSMGENFFNFVTSIKRIT